MTHSGIRFSTTLFGLFAVAAILTLGVSGQAFADSHEKKNIVPSDVYAAAVRMRADVDNLRFHMGKPAADEHDFEVSNAQPREVYFIARAVYLTANEFATQMTGSWHSKEIPLDLRDIKPANVFEIVTAADRIITDVLKHQSLERKTKSPPWADGKTPSDVYMQLLGVSDQLNLMMDRPFTPSHVFREVTRATKYAKHLIGIYEDHKYPREPDFEPGKIPGEVLCVDARLFRDYPRHSG